MMMTKFHSVVFLLGCRYTCSASLVCTTQYIYEYLQLA